MIFDVQKASILKRISAWLLDVILLVVVVVGIASALSIVTGYDDYYQQMEDAYSRYESQYGITFEITQEEYDALGQDERDNYDAAYSALIADEDAMYAYNMVLTLTLLILTLSILLAYLLMEFVVPMLLQNGQTIGKKVFGIAVMRTHGVKINGVCLFIRTVLGKYTIETMIPVLIIFMIMFNMTGLLGTLVIVGILAANIIIMCVNKNNAAIHDLLADTVTVDLNSQMIFNTEEELLNYKSRVAAEKAKDQPYF